MERRPPFNRNRKVLAVFSGVCFGAGLGITFGIALKHPLLGVGLGACFGASLVASQLAALKRKAP